MIRCSNCGRYNEMEFVTDMDCVTCGKERWEKEQRESFLLDQACEELEMIREYTER